MPKILRTGQMKVRDKNGNLVPIGMVAGTNEYDDRLIRQEIANEKAARESADEQLNRQIVSTVAGERTYLEGKVKEEADRAVAAEGTINASVTNLDTRVTALENEPKIPPSLEKDVADLKRDNKYLWDLNQGITYDFETDSDEKHIKDVPTGAKLFNVDSVGGKTVVWNQNAKRFSEPSVQHGVTVSPNATGTGVDITGTITTEIMYGQLSITRSFIFKRDGRRYLIFTDKDLPYNIGVNGFGAHNGATTEGYLFSSNTGADWIGNIFAFMNLGDSINVANVNVFAIDLKRMFGDDQPDSISDPRIAFVKSYAMEHPEYNEGQLISADVDIVSSTSNNVLDMEKALKYFRVNYEKVGSNAYKFSGLVDAYTKPFKFADVPGTYTMSGILETYGYKNPRIHFTLLKDDGTFGRAYGYISDVTGKFTAPNVNAIYLDHSSATEANPYRILRDIKIEKGSTKTPYTPYFKDEVPIPELIRNLPMYGVSVKDAANRIYRSGDRWVYRQECNVVCLGDFTWEKLTTADACDYLSRTALADKPSSGTLYSTGDCISPKYTVVDTWAKVSINNNSTGVFDIQIRCRDDSCATREAFKDANANTMLAYVMATPIETDITDLMQDILDKLPCEAGGTIEFHNEANLDMPNSIEYIVKVSEAL